MSEGIFYGADYPDVDSAWRLYQEGRAYNEQLDLYETVRVNENFFVGKQWEGVKSGGLPTPVFNILKRDVCFVVSNITTDNLKAQATALAASPFTEELREPVRIVNEELEALFDRNDVTGLTREIARDAAVRGDGCLYTYWDARTGEIRTETVENTRVYFGNPNDRRVQEQPYIIIESHDPARDVRREARENGCGGWESIAPDGELAGGADSIKNAGDKVTRLTVFWKDEDGEVWGFKCTENRVVKAPWRMGLRLYPITWLSWDYAQDCYHGQAMLTGLIPNQIFINKMWAMTMLSLMTSAYPKVVYDRTRIPKWSNQIGQAIGVMGGDMNSVARTIDPAVISPQVSRFIEMAVDHTNRNLGATGVALGDSRPDNTSAILALQRAAATPSAITKQNLHRCIEELARIYIDFIAANYGVRPVDFQDGTESFDFGLLRGVSVAIKLDVGASSYYSEIAAMQTLDNLLASGRISVLQYLERIPDGFIPDRRGLMREIEEKAQQGQGL